MPASGAAEHGVGGRMYSPTTAVTPSLIIAGAIFILSWLALSQSARYRDSGPLGATHAVGAAAAAFAVTFAVLNLALQWHVVNRNLVSQEITNGVLALRVISVTGAIAFGLLIPVAMREPKFVVRSTQVAGDWEIDRQLLKAHEQKVGKWPVQESVSQGTVLLLVLCLLWVLQVLRRDSLAIALLNWSFALVCDVFFMAASYRAERRVRPTLFHAMLLWAFGTTTFIMFCTVAFQQFAWWLACLIIASATYFLLWPGFYHFANWTMLRTSSVLRGWGIGEVDPVDPRDIQQAFPANDGDEKKPSTSKTLQSPAQSSCRAPSLVSATLTPPIIGLERVLCRGGVVRAVAISTDGCRAVSGSDDGMIRVWDLDTGELVHRLDGHRGTVHAVAVSADGTRAISGADDHDVRVWDLVGGESVYALKGHAGEVYAVAMSADGNRAVSGGPDGTALVWDLDRGTQVHSLEDRTRVVSAVAVSADGSRGFSGGADGSIRVWDLATGAPVYTLKPTHMGESRWQ